MESALPEAVALSDEVVATVASPEQVDEEVVIRIESARVRRLVRDRLDPVERRVIVWHFGLAGEQRLSLREIAARMNCSVGTAHNIERRALVKLRSEYGSEGLAA